MARLEEGSGGGGNKRSRRSLEGSALAIAVVAPVAGVATSPAE